VHDEVLDGNMFHFIIDKDADDTSMVTIYLQYHMNIFTDMSIKIIGRSFFFCPNNDGREQIWPGMGER
jgi:hypothetical protein